MADMMTKQMQKIEELTLYMIDQNKALTEMQKENTSLKAEKNKTDARLAALENMMKELVVQQ